MMDVAKQLSGRVGVSVACQVAGVPRGSFYRAQQPKQEPQPPSLPEAVWINKPEASS